jgi:hypothetical protein
MLSIAPPKELTPEDKASLLEVCIVYNPLPTGVDAEKEEHTELIELLYAALIAVALPGSKVRAVDCILVNGAYKAALVTPALVTEDAAAAEVSDTTLANDVPA